MEAAVDGPAEVLRAPIALLHDEDSSSSPVVSNAWVVASLQDMYTWNSCQEPLIDVTAPFPRSYFVEVPHVRQDCSWDCGLACVLMVLNALGIDGCDLKFLGRLCRTTSIWTVDLAHLLRLFAVDVDFLTVTIGANPSYAKESFYKENLDEDVERVNKLFERAAQVGIRIQWRTVPDEELSMLILSGRYIAIALVDRGKLRHPWLQELGIGDCCGLMASYVGHYIVVCGYDTDAQEFEIRDPASFSRSSRISLAAMHEARTSFGTDEDLLLISRTRTHEEAEAT